MQTYFFPVPAAELIGKLYRDWRQASRFRR
jgi:hypothetical protein